MFLYFCSICFSLTSQRRCRERFTASENKKVLLLFDRLVNGPCPGLRIRPCLPLFDFSVPCLVLVLFGAFHLHVLMIWLSCVSVLCNNVRLKSLDISCLWVWCSSHPKAMCAASGPAEWSIERTAIPLSKTVLTCFCSQYSPFTAASDCRYSLPNHSLQKHRGFVQKGIGGSVEADEMKTFQSLPSVTLPKETHLEARADAIEWRTGTRPAFQPSLKWFMVSVSHGAARLEWAVGEAAFSPHRNLTHSGRAGMWDRRVTPGSSARLASANMAHGVHIFHQNNTGYFHAQSCFLSVVQSLELGGNAVF